MIPFGVHGPCLAIVSIWLLCIFLVAGQLDDRLVFPHNTQREYIVTCSWTCLLNVTRLTRCLPKNESWHALLRAVSGPTLYKNRTISMWG